MDEPRVVGPGFNERVYQAVARVPHGSVASYGDIAAMLGARSVARQVGNALAALPAHRADVPWHRIVNSKGRISFRSDGSRSVDQIARLLAEGMEVDGNGAVVAFETKRWNGAD